jgi:hypothetical protein
LPFLRGRQHGMPSKKGRARHAMQGRKSNAVMAETGLDSLRPEGRGREGKKAGQGRQAGRTRAGRAKQAACEAVEGRTKDAGTQGKAGR